jgi:hypothetical protein
MSSPATPAPVLADPAAKPGAKRFHRFKPAMPREAAARQAQIAGQAWSVFKDRDAVMAFLNTHRDDLGGRPLDIAIASDDGLRSVAAVLAMPPA